MTDLSSERTRAEGIQWSFRNQHSPAAHWRLRFNGKTYARLKQLPNPPGKWRIAKCAPGMVGDKLDYRSELEDAKREAEAWAEEQHWRLYGR